MSICPYTTGTKQKQFPLPVTALLRPFVPVSGIDCTPRVARTLFSLPLQIVAFVTIRRALADFIGTIYESRVVLSLAFAFFVVASTTATALFKGYTGTSNGLGRGFDTLQVRLFNHLDVHALPVIVSRICMHRLVSSPCSCSRRPVKTMRMLCMKRCPPTTMQSCTLTCLLWPEYCSSSLF